MFSRLVISLWIIPSIALSADATPLVDPLDEACRDIIKVVAKKELRLVDDEWAAFLCEHRQDEPEVFAQALSSFDVNKLLAPGEEIREIPPVTLRAFQFEAVANRSEDSKLARVIVPPAEAKKFPRVKVRLGSNPLDRYSAHSSRGHYTATQKALTLVTSEYAPNSQQAKEAITAKLGVYRKALWKVMGDASQDADY